MRSTTFRTYGRGCGDRFLRTVFPAQRRANHSHGRKSQGRRLLHAVDECAKKQGVTRSHVVRDECKAYVASTGTEAVEDRLAALEARVKALEEGK